MNTVFSSTGRRPESLCHGPLSVVRPSVRASVRALTFSLKLLYLVSLNGECPNYSPGVKFSPALGFTTFTWELYRENFRNLPVPNHKAYGYQILHVAVSSGPSPRGVNYNPRVDMIAKGYKFYIGLYSEILRNFLVAKNKNYGYQF